MTRNTDPRRPANPPRRPWLRPEIRTLNSRAAELNSIGNGTDYGFATGIVPS